MKRRAFNWIFHAVTAACTMVALGVLFAIFAAILARGGSAIDWTFLTDSMKEAGAAGGVVYHILGTLILIATALALSTPVAFGVALTLEVYLTRRGSQKLLTLFLYIINGIPSILFGLFGLIVFVHGLNWGKSWLTGGVLLGLMILPTVTVSIASRMRAIPARYIDSAAALGLRRSQRVWAILIPYSVSGWFSGSLLGLARAAGETAPIMFTATVFSGAALPDGVQESPVLSLPYHIFVLAQESYNPEMIPNLWASAFVLVALVIGLSVISLPWRVKVGAFRE